MRALKFVGAALAAAIVVIALVLIIGIPSSFINSAIQQSVERETGYRMTVGGTTRISLWPQLNVTMNDVTLQQAKEREGASRLTAGSVQAAMTLASAWSGHPHITELIITKPVVSVPLLRHRETAAPAPSKLVSATEAVAIDRIKVADGAMVFSNPHDRVENRIDGIEAEATIDAERKIRLTGSAHAGASPLKFDVAVEAPTPPLEQRNIPVDIKIDAPDLLHAPLAAKAELRLAGSLIKFNGVSGTLGDGAFNGWASVDADSKPLVKVDLDFQQLNLPLASRQSDSNAQSWSSAPFDLTGLNYVDAQVRISSAQAAIGQVQFGPAEIEAALAGGVLKTSIPNLGAYGGQANGELIVDATNGGSPMYAIHCDLVGVSALPMLSSLADFDKIEGKLQAKIAARSSGNSQQAIMSNLSGTVFANFQDGAIRGVNVAQMIRSLTASTLSGWQQQREQATDLSQLSASFRIEHGQATTTDLNLVGPLVKVTGAGTVDLPTKQIGFRVEPKLVLTTEGQGRASDPVGFGIPVIIQGAWAEPRIYPEMAGILDNPDAAYAKLREMGKGLFGPNGGLSGLLGGLGGQNGGSSGNSGDTSDSQGGLLGETLGNLIQQGLSGEQGHRSRGISPNSSPQPQAAPQPPAPSGNSSQAQGGQQDSQPMNDVLKQLFSR